MKILTVKISKNTLTAYNAAMDYSKKQSSMPNMRAETLTMRGKFVAKMLRCWLKFIRSLRIIWKRPMSTIRKRLSIIVTTMT